MVRKLQIAAGILIILLFIIIPALIIKQQADEAPTRVTALPGTSQLEGFARVEGPSQLTFPADHGAHPDYQTEWWYYTGNLQAKDGRRFGFQLTFFRRAILPPDQMPERTSDWASSQVYMAHFALSDIEDGRFHAFERLSRGAAGLAGASAEPFQVWLEDWRVEQAITQADDCSNTQSKPCAYRLFAAQGDISLQLEMLDQKGPVLQGDQGYSQKGAEPGQASNYYSLTRLRATGQLVIGDQTFAVSGLSWVDHEWSTRVLSSEQVGWDWFSLQFEDGSELMVFQIRRADGSIDPYSSGTFVAKDGTTRRLEKEEFVIEITDTWKSPHSGAIYPSGWTMRIPSAGFVLEINPQLKDQELNVSYAYWEGAVRVIGMQDGVPMNGNGYVELTGYSGSMAGEF
jgi:predicted secreted hydrolase